MSRPEIVTLKMVREFDALTPEAANEYFRAQFHVTSLLKRIIIEPFEEALKDRTGFSRDNIPSETVETHFKLDDIDFVIKSSPSPRIEHQDVYTGFKNFLSDIQRDFQKGLMRDYLSVFDDLPFLSVDLLIDRIHEFRDENKKPTVMQPISYTPPDSLLQERLNELAIPLAYTAKLTAGNGVLYARSKRFYEMAERRAIEPFEEVIIKQTGYSKDNRPQDTVDDWVQLGKHLFMVLSVPYPSPKYGKVMDSLIYETPTGKITKKTGEFILIRERSLDSERAKHYILREESEDDGEPTIYVSVNSVLKRLDSLYNENVEKALRQSIYHFPLI